MQDNRRGGQRRDFGDRGGQRGGQRRDFGDRGERGGQRPPGGGDYGERRDFRGGSRDFPRERPYASDRGFAGDRRDRGPSGPGGPRASGRPPSDDGGMAIRLDPRRLSLLKELAGEQGLRPGELVTQWIQERLDAERSGGQAAGGKPDTAALDALSRRVDELAQRLDQLSAGPTTGSGFSDEPSQDERSNGGDAEAAPAAATASGAQTPQPAARRGRAPKATSESSPGRRVPLHDEIASVIAEGGPMSAAEIAQAILNRGRYSAPRSDRPLDAATVNSRVSNPIYRSRFRREDGKIGLSE